MFIISSELISLYAQGSVYYMYRLMFTIGLCSPHLKPLSFVKMLSFVRDLARSEYVYPLCGRPPVARTKHQVLHKQYSFSFIYSIHTDLVSFVSLLLDTRNGPHPGTMKRFIHSEYQIRRFRFCCFITGDWLL